MSIVHQEFIGNYKKLKHCSGIVYGAQPRKLNENRHVYGYLRNKLDLNIGKEAFKDEGAGEKLESILMFIEQYASNNGNKCLREIIDCDFVSTRNLLVSIACAVYDAKDVIQFQAVRYKDVIFLYKIEKEWISNGGNAQFGYKFEQYLTLDEYENENDPNTPVSNAEQEKVVLRTELRKNQDSIKLCYGAEVDAIDQDGKYVECKTVSGPFNPFWFNKRSLKTYLQSYIGNIPTIVFGHHKFGMVEKVSKLETSKIPKMSNEIKWKPERCIDKLFDVLAKVKSDLSTNGMAKLYVYKQNELSSESIASTDCDFVGDSFIDKFE